MTVDLRFSESDEQFRAEVRDWLETSLSGEWKHVRGTGGPGSEHEHLQERAAWEKHLGAAGWIGIDWPEEHGGRAATLTEHVVFHEEYARAGGPGRLGHMGEYLLAPTVLAFGTDEQKRRFLPGVKSGEVLWCQGYSEPGAGSDLANVRTKAVPDGDEWVITGQKVWTSLAHVADWCFVLCRTDSEAPKAGSSKHAGLSFLLVPMHQDGIVVRPIVQITGTSEFNEVFFDGARANAADMLGAPGDGWRVAMGLLGYERGVATLGQQVGFARELDALCAVAKQNGKADDPLVRDRLAQAWIGLRVMRYHALVSLGNAEAGVPPGTEASVSKLLWATWHQQLGELAMDVLGVGATVADGEPYELDEWQRLYLFTRSDTIYGGSHEVQRGIVAERGLGLPRSR
ncbi:MAG TPA: acyl-CoA dehydrogenase family protein [Mycobacteriales bacterium]|nr:acyl-CoA dehydrogenase family protein [Mycobacteriales bacterium]